MTATGVGCEGRPVRVRRRLDPSKAPTPVTPP